MFLFFQVVVFSQQLEEHIYAATESFIENKNNNSFESLSKKGSEFKLQISSKDEQLAFVFLECNRAYFLKNVHRSKEAISIYESTWAYFESNHLSGYDMIENCLKPLGNLYIISKDYANAENTIKQYLFLAETTKNSFQKTAALINLSILYQTLGKHQQVITLTKIALEDSNPTKNQIQKLENIQLDSQFWLYQNLDELAIPQRNTYANFYRRSQLAIRKGDFAKAKLNLEKAKILFFEQENITARMISKLYLSESYLLLKSNKRIEATKVLVQSLGALLPNWKGIGLPKLDELYPENTFIDIFDLWASIETSPKKALQYYDLSFYVSDLLRSSISSQEVKIINQIDSRLRSEKCIELLYQQYVESNDDQFIIHAFQYTEKNKVSVLKEIIHKKLNLELHPSDELLIKEQQLLKEQEFVTNQLMREQLVNGSMVAQNNLSKELSSISYSLKRVREKIATKYLDLEPHETSIDQIQKKLNNDNAILIEYFYGSNALYQFVLYPDKMEFQKMKLTDSVKQEVSEFIHFFDTPSSINNNINNFTIGAFDLYKSLNLSQIEYHENLVIIPDGLLNFIPFEALLTTKTKTTRFSEMPFFLKGQKIVYNSSAEFYMRPLRENSNKNLLGVFPVFKNTSKELRYSLDEANAIKNELNSTFLMNEDATKKHFLREFRNYGILHLSTHASSGDFSSSASIDFFDKKMYLNELYGLDLNPDLVVLSACETGVGILQKGEGVMSIARGFQYAGAKNILFSLWKINDQSTSKIMQMFYEEYREERSFFVANHNSKLEYLNDESIKNNKKSPYYWGAFMYYGEFSKPITSINRLSIIGFSGLLGFLILIVMWIHRKQS